MSDHPRPAPRTRPDSTLPTPSTPVDGETDGSAPSATAGPVTDAPDVTVPLAAEPGALARLRKRFVDRRRTGLSARQSWVIAVVSIVVVAVAITAAVFALRSSDPAPSAAPGDERTALLTDPGQADAFVAGASSAIAAVTSYDYRDLDSALSAGEAVTTGSYRTSYRAALLGELGAQARRDKIVQTFAMTRAGIGSISANGRQAKVLVFGIQTATLNDGKAGDRSMPVTLTATMVNQGANYRISDLVVGASAGLPPGSEGLSAAAETAREQVENLLSYRRANFAADLDRARRSAVDPLDSMLAAKAKKTKAELTKGGYDLVGTVTAIAVERASGDTVVMLVAASGTKVSDTGARSEVTDGRYEVAVVYFDGQWRTSIVAPADSP